jgi:hypothetical protein
VLLLLLLQVLLQVLVQVLVQVQVQVPIEKRMSDFCPLTCVRRGNRAPRGGEGARMRRRARTQSGAARGGAGEGGRGGGFHELIVRFYVIPPLDCHQFPRVPV